jgi:hypothetical protein
MNSQWQAFLRQCKSYTLEDTRNSTQMRFIIGLRNKLVRTCNDPIILSGQAGDLACAANVSVSNLPEELLQDTIDGVANIILPVGQGLHRKWFQLGKCIHCGEPDGYQIRLTFIVNFVKIIV